MIHQPIFITGTSGIGKTTLASYLSKRYLIPFVQGSSTVIWDKYGVKNHREIIQMGANDPQKGLEFQLELLKIRENTLRDISVRGFVTDRFLTDNLVYFLLQNAPYLSDADVEAYIEACKNSMETILESKGKKYKLIYLSRDFPKGGIVPILEDDQKRITSDIFQDTVSAVFDYVVKSNKLGLDLNPYRYLKVDNYEWEKRLKKTKNFISREPGDRNLLDKLFNPEL